MHKMSQGQSRATIRTIWIVIAYMMIHSKFQGHRSIGSGEDAFLSYSLFTDMAAMLVT